jgi:hypothetical protein
VNVLTYPLAAMAGGVIGVAAHETIHYALAELLGEVVGAGWAGGLAGGPFVDYRVPRSVGGWRSETIRKGPLAAGIAAAIALAFAFDGVTVPWLVGAGAVAGLLWTSPEDLFRSAAEQPEAIDT